MLRIVLLLLLAATATPAAAWPWTTPEDCQREHATKAQGKWSLNAIYASCKWAYGENQTDHDASRGECFIDRIDEPKSEVAFQMLMKQCTDEAPPPPRPPLPSGFTWEKDARTGE